MTFENRHDAGRRLGQLLEATLGARAEAADVVVVGLPRGGVPVAFEVAEALGAPLDVVVVRKLGVPFQPELAMGAVAEGGIRVVDDRAVRAAGLDDTELDAMAARERVELDEQAGRLRRGRSRVELASRTVVVVDDGIATGATATAACQVVRALGAARVVLAAPVGPAGHVDWLRQYADDVICVAEPEAFFAVGQFYVDFSQTSDDEVVNLLDRAARRHAPDSDRDRAVDRAVDRDVEIAVGGPPRMMRLARSRATLPGRLTVPSGSGGLRGVVVFVHGTGSSRNSPRNRAVAAELNRAGLATLLFDLLAAEQTGTGTADGPAPFNLEVFARRLDDVGRWLREVPELRGLPLAYFGASTGAAVALWAAAEPGADIASIVSRGGRPDLAADRLGEVRAPTIFVVGERDDFVLSRSHQARIAMPGETQVAVVPGASHLFAEPGAIETVATLARDWFLAHLPVGSAAARPS